MTTKKHLRRAAAALGFATIGIAASANAYEAGAPGWEQMPGIVLGASAGTPGPGLYMFNQTLTTQSTIVGPGAPLGGGVPVHLASTAIGFLWVPGWTFLGATYDAVLVQPVSMLDVGAPLNFQKAGAHNTYIVPGELSWRFGDSGFVAKTGLGIYVPDGSISGANGLGSIGNPWWTFQPELFLSYLKDGWNLTAFLSEEINTANTITSYRSGNVLHAEFTATKSIGKWTVGPVGYYVGQVTDDRSSAFYRQSINTNRFDIYAAGALVGYNFGPAALNVWAVDEFYAKAWGGGPPGSAVDTASVTKGYKVFANLSFRIWAPEEPIAPKRQLLYK